MEKTRKIFFMWIILGILALVLLSNLFKTAFPLLTLIWLIVSFIVVLIKRDPQRVGFKKVSTRELIKVTAINLILSLAIITIVELLTHTYQQLVQIAMESTDPDITFVWLQQNSRIIGYAAMFVFSGLVTLFAEELFFRGMLLQWFKRKMNDKLAILLQSLLFSLPHIILALFMTPIQGIVIVVIYGIVIYGLVGGWAANRTNSIWPSLITATVNNLILTMIYFK